MQGIYKNIIENEDMFEEDEEEVLYSQNRHLNLGIIQKNTILPFDWKIQRLKTSGIGIVLCLNLGVDPPDVIRTDPCAKLECWIDPSNAPASISLENISKELEKQYERWQFKPRVKTCYTPSIPDIQRLCVTLRRFAKTDRVLFHYNGHGVPRPTENGELWVFDKKLTQYIPMSIYDLQQWLEGPSVYVIDSSGSGIFPYWYNRFVEMREQGDQEGEVVSIDDLKSAIIFAACGPNETLPTSPNFPADVFTSCLTTPIKMALNWHVMNSPIYNRDTTLVERIPGRASQRNTPLGELNWIFTAVTDSIAFDVLPNDVFLKLFREDILVASLFRNFLLANRVLRSVNCTPISIPQIPQTNEHPMWKAWDYAVDQILTQIPTLLREPHREYVSSDFFNQQLNSLEVWLVYAKSHFEEAKLHPPTQLPIILQVLLSQSHREEALKIISKFVDLGPWAVNTIMSIDIFPYLIKLFKSPTSSLKWYLSFIWSKILSLDKVFRTDLIGEKGHVYFIRILDSESPDDYKILSLYILCVICDDYITGQSACFNERLLPICLTLVTNKNNLIRQWSVLCLSKLWQNFAQAKNAALNESAHVKLCSLLSDPVPEVRASAAFALGTFIATDKENSNVKRDTMEVNIGLTLRSITNVKNNTEASPMVRREICVALCQLAISHQVNFSKIVVLLNSKKSEIVQYQCDLPKEQQNVYQSLYKHLLFLRKDPHLYVSSAVSLVIEELQKGVRDINETPRDKRGNNNNNDRDRDSSPKRNSEKISKQDSFLKSLFSPKKIPLNPNNRTREIEIEEPSEINRLFEETERNNENNNYSQEISFYEWSAQKFCFPCLSYDGRRLINKKQKDPSCFESEYLLYNKLRYKKSFSKISTISKIKNCKLEHQNAITHSNTLASNLLFHPSEPLLLFSGQKTNSVVVWKWKNEPINEIKTGSPVSSMCFAEPCYSSILLVGGMDGCVRVYNDIASSERMVTSWRAAICPVLMTHFKGVNQIVTAGNIPYVRIWDVDREYSIEDIKTGTNIPVTALTSGKTEENSNLFVAGFGNGSIRVFDRRVSERDNNVISYVPRLHSWTEHSQSIVNLFIPEHTTTIVSGSTDGLVKFWDLRKDTKASYNTFDTRTNAMSSFSVHNHAPLFVCGYRSQKIEVFNFDGQSQSQIKYRVGFLEERIGPISSVGFHPTKTLLAAASFDGFVSVYSNKEKKI